MRYVVSRLRRASISKKKKKVPCCSVYFAGFVARALFLLRIGRVKQTPDLSLSGLWARGSLFRALSPLTLVRPNLPTTR